MKTKLGQFLLIAVIGLVGVLSASAQTNLAQPSKNDLIGTWRGADSSRKMATFTADEVTFYDDLADLDEGRGPNLEEKFKYTHLSNNEIKLTSDGKISQTKITLEGEVLTVINDKGFEVRYRRDLFGTWVGVEDPKVKIVFTVSEVAFKSLGIDGLYTRLSNNVIRIEAKGEVLLAQITFEGEVLKITVAQGSTKYKRESANAANSNANAKTTAPNNPQTFKNSIGMEFVKIPAGSFLMGSPTSEKNRRPDEGPQRQVTLSKDFYMGTTEVTQEQYEKVMGSHPSYFTWCPKCPVEKVSWEDAQEFIKKLNAKNEGVYRLPTEAEWEYAARAGTTGEFAGDVDSMAWYASNSKRKTNPVATKTANAWGLYDMHGNVWEWCEDIYNDNYTGLPVDGSANMSVGDSSRRVSRGGSWNLNADLTRSAFRGRNVPSLRNNLNGFRVVKN